MEAKVIRNLVKGKYGEAAMRAKNGGSSCCGASPPLVNVDPITSNLYSSQEREGLPADAVAASLGCGNPTALAELHVGETVLDLGSGGGIDVFLSGQRVGPTGKAYGLDMTDEMLALARDNQRQAGVENVEFLKGEIEQIPLPDRSVDVIISNCVINLSGEKERVFAEVFRVLRPGGRLALSDIVVRGTVPAEIRRHLELWAGCVAGALEETEYCELLGRAGFVEIGIEPTRVYQADDVKSFLAGTELTSDRLAAQADGKFMSAFIRARKPAVSA
ncbi:MAG: SAM-dependent methyltransferase [Nitrospira sp.]|nr:MAG: SAM-dependent methyltransferase [Nitrospira sp.]